jgi:GNAT superfamily N-acetyltransferase
VTLPDFQGLGIGPRLSDWVAEAYVRQGCNYYGKTAHPRLGEYRDRHPNWVATSVPRTGRKESTKPAVSFGGQWTELLRDSFSHRYVLSEQVAA